MKNEEIIIKATKLQFQCKGNNADNPKERLIQEPIQSFIYEIALKMRVFGAIIIIMTLYLKKMKRIYYKYEDFIIEDHSSLQIMSDVFKTKYIESCSYENSAIKDKSFFRSIKLYIFLKKFFEVNNKIDNSLIIEISFWTIFFENIYKNTNSKLPVLITDDVTTRSTSLVIAAKTCGYGVGMLAQLGSPCESSIKANLQIIDLLIINTNRQFNYYCSEGSLTKFCGTANEKNDETIQKIKKLKNKKIIGILPGYNINTGSLLNLVQHIKVMYPNIRVVIKIHPREKLSENDMIKISREVQILQDIEILTEVADVVISGNTQAIANCLIKKIPSIYTSVIDNYGDDYSGYVANGLLPKLEIKSLTKDINEVENFFNEKKWKEIIDYYGINNKKNLMNISEGLEHLKNIKGQISYAT
jgi:hypothetical protein